MDGSKDPVIYEWALVEVFGHRKHYGRTCEVERFGAKLLRVDVPTAPAAPLLGDPERFETHFYGGAAIFSFTPMTEELARRYVDRYRPEPYEPIRALPPRDRSTDYGEVDYFAEVHEPEQAAVCPVCGLAGMHDADGNCFCKRGAECPYHCEPIKPPEISPIQEEAPAHPKDDADELPF